MHTMNLNSQEASNAYSDLIRLLWKLEIIRLDLLGLPNQPSIWRKGLYSSADSIWMQRPSSHLDNLLEDDS